MSIRKVEKSPERKEYERQYYLDNKEKKRQYYLDNKERIASNAKLRYDKEETAIKNRKYSLLNADKAKERAKKWRQDNPSKANNHSAIKRARKKKWIDTNSEADTYLIQCLYEFCRFKTRTTGVEHHVDHIYPLARGGSHTINNLQILTAEDNIKKGCKCQ